MPIADVLSGDLLLLIGAGLRIVDCGQLAACAPWLADACGGRARAAPSSVAEARARRPLSR